VSKDARLFRPSQTVGDIAAIPILGGLLHLMFTYKSFAKDKV